MKASAVHAEAFCPVVAACGGCPLYTLGSAAERDRKLAAVESSLSRLGPLSRIEWIPSPSRSGYRNRIRLQVLDSGEVAFFNRHKDASCAALEQSLRSAVDRVRALGDASRAAFAYVAHLEVRKPDRHHRPSVFLASRGSGADLGDAHDVLAREFVVASSGTDGRGEVRTQDYDLRPDVFARVPLGSFMQVNSAVNALLVEALCARVRRSGAATALDLFAGSGNFALPIAKDGVETAAVERDAAAVRALRDAAFEQGLAVEAVVADAVSLATAWAAEGRAFDVVVADGPRAGLKRGHAAIASLARRAIAVCSCNPDTFAADAARLATSGFRLRDVSVFDMFPGTTHVELLGWFERA